MDNKIAVFLAEGFEETEAIATIDLMRRAGLTVSTFSVSEDLKVEGANQISVYADNLFSAFDAHEFDMLILPGGMPGTLNLQKHEALMEALTLFATHDKWLAAICAAPSVFGELGLLEGKHATCYPSFEDKLRGATWLAQEVVVDGKVITSRGIGTVIPFALTIIAQLLGEDKVNEIKQGIVFKAGC
ncbi:MAG: DJ-1 family glyoxalase III [Mangrovibacterium sp.]